jgi:HlyD family secretion protein
MASSSHPVIAHQQGAATTAKADDFRKSGSSTTTAAHSISKRFVYIALILALAAGAAVAWYVFSAPALPAGFAAGNGRLEATQIYVASKYPGRVTDILFNEGDTVEAGQVVARMDTSALNAQLNEALAQIKAAQDSRNVSLAQVQVKQADYNYAAKQYARSRELVTKGAVSGEEAELDQSRALANRAELVGAQAEATRTVSNIDAAKATADRLRAEIKDAVLVAPLRARVETRLAEPGEVLPQGGRVFSLDNLADVYMYVFLPESVTGKIKVGSEARIVLDAAPQYPIRAYVSYVSPMAQFTPKTVETAEERHNLSFRVKLQIDPQRLREFEALVKVGLPGMGYVRSDTNADWPESLRVKQVNPQNLWNPTGATASR